MKIAQSTWNALKSNWERVASLLTVIVFLVILATLSTQIAPNRDQLDVENVLGTDQIHFLLIAASAILIISTFYLFINLIFKDQKEYFTVTEYQTLVNSFLFFLILIFIAQVFILLDVAIVNIYLTHAAVSAYWFIVSVFEPMGTDLIAYAQIRTNIFVTLFVITFSIPLIMFLAIFSKTGREFLATMKRPSIKRYRFIIMVALIFNIFIAILLNASLGQDGDLIFQLIGIGIYYILLLIVTGLLLVVLETLRIFFHLTSSYILMVIPIVGFFYLLPAVLWTLWDIAIVYVGGDLTKTYYTAPPTSQQMEKPLQLIVDTFAINIVAVERILELDFIFIIGAAALVIGYAEGYSLLAIFTGIFKGRKVTRAGILLDVGTSSNAVRVTRTAYLFAWISLFWDKLIDSLSFLTVSFNMPFDFALQWIPFEVVAFDFAFIISEQFTLPLGFLVLPAIIIINSSFKFLSISLVTKYTKQNISGHLLIISSAFLMIIVKIYADIASTSLHSGQLSVLLPLATLSGSPILEFAINILNNLEAFAFFAGLVAVITRPIWKKKQTKQYDEHTEPQENE